MSNPSGFAMPTRKVSTGEEKEIEEKEEEERNQLGDDDVRRGRWPIRGGKWRRA